MEAKTRKLGSAEKTWRQQKKEARRAGKLQGITRGTAAAMEEVARASANFGINGIKKMMSAKAEGTQERIRNRAKNKKTHGDMRREMREEAYKTKIYDVDSYSNKVNIGGKLINPNARAAKLLKAKNEKEEQKRLETNKQQLLDDVYHKLILGNKNAPAGEVQKAWENKENIYKLVYGDEPEHKYDQPKSDNQQEGLLYTAARSAKTYAKSTASKGWSKAKNYTTVSFDKFMEDMAKRAKEEDKI